MSGREEKRREEEYVYRHIDIDIKKRERRIYIPFDWQAQYIKLKLIVEREGSTVSEWFRKQGDIYIRLHEPGNPQQDLKRILETGKPYRAPLVCACGVQATRKVTLTSGSVMFCCGVHMPRDVKFWKTIK